MDVMAAQPTLTVHPASVTVERARELLEGEAYGPLSPKRALRGMSPDELVALDQMYVPHWYCRVQARMADGIRTYEARDFWIATEAVTGAVWQTRETPPIQHVPRSATAPAIILPPTITREEAERGAREGLRWDVIFRGRLRARLDSCELLESRLVHVPFWIGYFRGQGEQLRVRIVHGLEGRVLDERTTLQLLRAAAIQNREETTLEEQRATVDQHHDDRHEALAAEPALNPQTDEKEDERPYTLPYIYGSGLFAVIGILVLIGALTDQNLLWAKILVIVFLFAASLFMLRKYLVMRRR